MTTPATTYRAAAQNLRALLGTLPVERAVRQRGREYTARAKKNSRRTDMLTLDPLLGLPEAAQNLEMTPSELRRLVAAREIAVVRRGARGHIKFRLSEIEAWKKRNTVPAEPAAQDLVGAALSLDHAAQLAERVQGLLPLRTSTISHAQDQIELALGIQAPSEHQLVLRMAAHGGEFAKALAQAWTLADNGNRERLRDGFGWLLAKYVQAPDVVPHA